MNLPYPVKPYKVNQPWGVKNPIYKAFGFESHNGVDIAPGNGKLVCSEIKGSVYKTGNQPTGGGIYLSILSDEMYAFKDLNAYILIDYLHAEKLLVQAGQSVEVGQPLLIADNTGFSTGIHTHIQYRRVAKGNGTLIPVDSNDANNSFDPEPYRDGTYAVDLYQRSILEKLVALYKKLLNK